MGLRSSNGAGIGKRKVGECFTVERVLAERGAYSRYLAYDHRVGEARLIELQRVEPREQTAWMARAETALRLHHPSLIRCLESKMLSDTQGLLVFEKPLDEIVPEPFEPMAVARFGLSLASLLALFHRVGFGFHVPLTHRAYWHKQECGVDVRVEVLSCAVGGFYREPFCARCLPDVPPELAKGDPPSVAGDQFILGAFFHRLLTGKPLHTGERDHHPSPQEGLEGLIFQMVQSDPERRPRSVGVLCRSLIDILKGSGGLVEPPPSFGWIEPRNPQPDPRSLARCFVVPGLSQAAIERMAIEDKDIDRLVTRIAGAVWRDRSDEKAMALLRSLERKGLCRENDRLQDAIQLRRKGQLERAEKALSDPSVRGFDRWCELARLEAVAGNGCPAVKAWRRAVTEADTPIEEAKARGGLGEQLARVGRLREGSEEISLALELLSGGEQKMVLRDVQLSDATVDLLTGRWLRARETLERLLVECSSGGDAWLQQQVLLKMAELDLNAGEVVEAMRHIKEAVEIADSREDIYGQLSGLLLEMESNALRGEWSAVLKNAISLNRQLADVPFGRLKVRSSLLLARAAAECGKWSKAEDALEEIGKRIRQLGEPAMEARFDGVNALYLARRGRSSEAVLVFEKAIEMLEGTSHPLLLAELYKDYVFACSGVAPDDLVRLRRQAARRTASDLGAKSLMSALDAELSVGGRRPAPVVPGFIASSPIMCSVLEKIGQAAGFDVPVHLKGESGTGKELLARAIHNLSPRSGKKIVAFNCAALPDSLLETELFGHVRGAFTGADRARIGLLEEAHGGTLFLDEVAELSRRGQTLLLRVLQEREYRRLGESALRSSNFRLISATHKRIEEEVAGGRFREDLYFRLKVVEIELPPLRERREDLLLLAEYQLGVKSTQLGLPRPSLTGDAEKALLAYSWPGNVRELENEMVQALLRLDRKRQLDNQHLSPTVRGKKESPLRLASEDFERRFLRDALVRHRGNRTRAARALGVTRQALYKKLRKYGMEFSRAG